MRNSLRTLTPLMFLIAVLFLFCTTTCYATIVDSGECGVEGDNVKWTKDDKGKVIISGNGEMLDFKNSGPWQAHYPETTSVEIQSGVTSIGENAFAFSEALTKITIPISVVKIGKDAFNYCDNLKTAGPIGGGYDIQFGWTDSIPDNAFCITYVSAESFPDDYNPSALKSIVFPESLKAIGQSAFSGCNQLSQIYLPDSIEEIGVSAFDYCVNLESINIPRNLINKSDDWIEWRMGIFRGCKKLLSAGPKGGNYNIIIESETIPLGLFSGNEYIESVIIPDGVTKIEPFAFEDCTNLCSVIIPDTVVSADTEHCGNKGEIFRGCPKLKTIGAIGSGCDIQFGWSECIPEDFFSHIGSAISVTIPDGVWAIGENAFYGCENLEHVVIPESVTTMGAKIGFDNDINSWYVSFSNYGTVFGNCKKIKSAGPIGSECNLEYGWKKKIPAFAFCRDEYLEKVIIPASVVEMGDENNYSFSRSIFKGCKQLKTAGPIGGDYNIQYGWSYSIPEGAFSHADCLEMASIPDGITEIGEKAFYCCEKLCKVYLPHSVQKMGKSVFKACKLINNAGPKEIAASNVNALSSNYSLNSNTITAYNLEFGWNTNIPENAFHEADRLEKVTLPRDVQKIGNNAFYKCKKVTDVYYPGDESQWRQVDICNNECLTDGSVTIHYNYNEDNCYTSKTLGGILREGEGWKINWGVTYEENSLGQKQNAKLRIELKGESSSEKNLLLTSTLGTGTTMPWLTEECGFKKTDFKEITILGSIKNNLNLIYEQFKGYSNVEKVILLGVSSIDQGAFENCSSLTTIDCGSYLTEIGSYAFANTSLKRIELRKSVSSIGKDAFSGCDDLTIYCYLDSLALRYAQNNFIDYVILDHVRSNELDFSKDVWSFKNYEDDQCKQDVSLLKELSPASRAVMQYTLARGREGHCFGMSATVILNKIGVDNIAALYNAPNIREIKDNDLVKARICYYAATQALYDRSKEIVSFSRYSDKEKLDLLASRADTVKDGGTPVLLGVGSKTGSGHALVAYAVESGIFKSNATNKQYDHRILVYDPNFTEFTGQSCLLYNEGTDQWEMPFYEGGLSYLGGGSGYSSEKGGVLKYATNDINVFDAKQDTTGYNAEVRIASKTKIIITDNSGAEWIVDPTIGLIQGPDVTYYYDSDSEIDAIEASSLHIVLPNPDAVYSFKTESGNAEDLDIHVLYDDKFLSVDADAASGAKIDPYGSVAVEGNKGKYELVAADDTMENSGKYDTFAVAGENSGNTTISLKATGAEISGDNIQDSTVTASNVEESSSQTIKSEIKAFVESDVKKESDDTGKDLEIKKKKNTMTVKAKAVSLKAPVLKKKDKKIKKSKAFTVSKNQGKVTFKMSKIKKTLKKKITISKDGVIKVKKGTKKGKYQFKVAVTAAGNESYKPLTRTVTVTIKVK